MKIIASLVAVLLLATSAHAGERTAIFSVPGMTCALCPITVKTAMGRVDGVISAEADLESKSAEVVFDDTRTSIEVIKEASANAGYPASLESIQ